MGPRQVGKTTIALNIAETTPSIYLDLESRLDLEKVRDIDAFHADNNDKLIILDEVQRLPEVFAPLRGIIDKERRRCSIKGQTPPPKKERKTRLHLLREPKAGIYQEHTTRSTSRQIIICLLVDRVVCSW